MHSKLSDFNKSSSKAKIDAVEKNMRRICNALNFECTDSLQKANAMY